jgi:hypothetical protein
MAVNSSVSFPFEIALISILQNKKARPMPVLDAMTGSPAREGKAL